MPPPRSINIGPYSFPITAGYTSGAFAVSEAELEVLDSARAERVRKKGHRALEKLRARSGRRTLSEAELRHLTTEIAGFDGEMRLERLPDSRGPGATSRPLARAAEADVASEPDFAEGEFAAEVAKLAAMRLAAEEAARGLTLTPAQRGDALAALADDPLIRDAARARVEVALRERERMLTELF